MVRTTTSPSTAPSDRVTLVGVGRGSVTVAGVALPTSDVAKDVPVESTWAGVGPTWPVPRAATGVAKRKSTTTVVIDQEKSDGRFILSVRFIF